MLKTPTEVSQGKDHEYGQEYKSRDPHGYQNRGQGYGLYGLEHQVQTRVQNKVEIRLCIHVIWQMPPYPEG